MKEEMKKCLNCEKELVGRKRKFCSVICRDRFRYNNNEEYRLKKIEASKKRVYEQRELERVEKEKNLIIKMLNDISKEKTEVEMNIEALFNLINNK